MKGADIKLSALNNKRIEVLECGLHFTSAMLFSLYFDLSNYFFNANIYTIKGHPHKMQSLALEDFSMKFFHK